MRSDAKCSHSLSLVQTHRIIGTVFLAAQIDIMMARRSASFYGSWPVNCLLTLIRAHPELGSCSEHHPICKVSHHVAFPTARYARPQYYNNFKVSI
jgi:hypothetical protein